MSRATEDTMEDYIPYLFFVQATLAYCHYFLALPVWLDATIGIGIIVTGIGSAVYIVTVFLKSRRKSRKLASTDRTRSAADLIYKHMRYVVELTKANSFLLEEFVDRLNISPDAALSALKLLESEGLVERDGERWKLKQHKSQY